MAQMGTRRHSWARGQKRNQACAEGEGREKAGKGEEKEPEEGEKKKDAERGPSMSRGHGKRRGGGEGVVRTSDVATENGRGGCEQQEETRLPSSPRTRGRQRSSRRKEEAAAPRDGRGRRRHEKASSEKKKNDRTKSDAKRMLGRRAEDART